MTDNNEPTPDSGAEETSAGGDQQNSRDRGWRGLDAVIIVLLVVALGLGGISLYLARQLLDQQQGAMERQNEHAGTLTELVANQEELQAVVRRVDEAQQATTAALERFAERERMDNLDWAMAEVEYLTIIAMQRLSLGSDADTAQAALEAAARRLKDIDNPSLIPVREQLTSDINALRAVPETDVPGLALYLGDLITRAEQLPLASDSASRSVPATGSPADEEVDSWRGMVQAMWNELRQLVVIQREDSPPTELLAPDQRYFLYQNLRTELASARAAALRRDTRNLRASIELIQDWLDRYFNTDAEAVANIKDSLSQMKTLELAPELPDISGSLESVRAWQRRHAETPAGD